MEQSSTILAPYLSQLQSMYGTFDPNQVQLRRRGYYSFIAYPTTGATQFVFFATAVGASNRQLTNIQRSGHLDNPFLLKAIRTRYFITSQNNSAWAGTDASTLFSDIVNGFFTAGVLRLVVGSKEWFQIPSPFQYAPAAYGVPEVFTAGNLATNTSHAPYAYPGSSADEGAGYIIDPEFLIGDSQNFQCSIEFPAGAIPVIASTVVPNSTTLYIGVEFDGIELCPVQ
jgi:hypothetical protein